MIRGEDRLVFIEMSLHMIGTLLLLPYFLLLLLCKLNREKWTKEEIAGEER